MDKHRSCHRWDEEERRKEQNPEAILADIGLKPGHIFIDIGCGEGFFALPAARMVVEKGKVYGVDISEGAIGRLRQRASEEGLKNLFLEVSAAEDSVLCEACADFVFFGMVLHDFKEPDKVLANARIMLKPSGKLVNLDWKKEPMEFGPPLRIRFNEEEAAGLIEAQGFRVEAARPAGPRHYIIIASPGS